jgi:hypothetical protein
MGWLPGVPTSRFVADSLLEGTGFEPPVPLVPKALLAANPGRRHEKRSLKAQVETPIIARSALPQLLRSRWDREFESVFLQQPVCLSSEPRGCRGKAPHFGGILWGAGDVRRDVQAANRASFALSL